MASTTLLQLKNWFARFIGENDYTSLDAVATSLLNDAWKELSSLIALKCNLETSEVTVSSGVGSLPTNLDYSHPGQIKVYKYSGLTKYEYERVDLDDFSSYDSSDYVYAIDFKNEKIKLPADATIQIDFYRVPVDLSDNTDTINCPVSKAIARMAVAQYWQSIEEDPDQAKLNFAFAESLIAKVITQNKKMVPYKKSRPYGGRDLGFN